MLVKVIKVEAKGFKSHQDLTVNFGEETKITGDNAQGKSSLLETLSWTLYGLNLFGAKLDPTPIGYATTETLVQVLLEVDGKKLLLGRGSKKGKASYYVNEVPSKAKEFNEIVEQLFDKELFFSLYNPNYFFTLHWEKQRSMLLQYVSAPTNKQVFKELPETQSEVLATLVKKHSLDDLAKIHRENKTKMEKAHIAAQSRTKTLNEQINILLENIGEVTLSNEELEANAEELRLAILEADKVPAQAFAKNSEYNKVKSELGMVQHQIDMSKERFPSLKNEQIEDTCRTCKRPLDEEAVKAVEEDKNNRIQEYKANHSKLIERKKELQTQLDSIEVIDVTEEQQKVRELEAKRDKVADKIRTHKQHEQLLTQVEEAKKDEQAKLESLNDSIFILDSIKAFKAKEAELQGEKVQELFNTLSVRLFDKQKNGEIKPTFEIEYDGRPYSKLSLSESIRAGLELREVLSKQSEIVAPVFVDNAESITSFKEPTGQLIICKVVAGQELKIEVSE
ncbi:AAA family ATPase [Halalkalibacter krulwichiae]|uniref:Nuclease SbcCD subunit C n=1 Tax=Halalkalibacter krulwichiae TaxID=199441 RepID=A0A1X9MHV3_9BACI|nr:AAA family ATPase [Halalkalibacter krulwichiae]ARK32170.1 chromosome segregation protein [Halalkalibacter krulwichiae]